MRVRRLAQGMRRSALEPGTSGKPRSVCHRHLVSSESCFVLTTSYCGSDGDIHFQAPRRFWSQTTLAPNYVYLFTDPQPSADPALGVALAAELRYLFGGISTTGPPKVANLSRRMLDYWISFAVSLTPNDGKGTSSALGRASSACCFL